MDNFYVSPLLLDILLSYRTDGFGTMRAERKGLPVKITNTTDGRVKEVSLLKSTKLKKEEIAAWTRVNSKNSLKNKSKYFLKKLRPCQHCSSKKNAKDPWLFEKIRRRTVMCQKIFLIEMAS